MNVLVVEDDLELTQFIQKGLQSEGATVAIAFDGVIGRSMVNENKFDVVVLDVNLPGLNGYDLCRFIKQNWPAVPVIMLTALGSLDNKVMGFEAGADDYLAKPFAFKELLFRLKALARRHPSRAPRPKRLQLLDLEVETDSHRVWRAGERVELTAREYALLEYFMLNQGKVINRVDLLENVWDVHFNTNTNVVDVYVNYLRRKIDKSEPRLLHTVFGVGYLMGPEP
ncbi:MULTISPECIES: response regulator transcription factor [Dyadobacter]|jgi:DNA-binding response OmpR family regulator|uniref:Response regulator transcription factor n=2 Tax=Dyadobacter TaxID=120831 RepID=A0A5R9K6G0_9BACT|nr:MULTISPECIES: response regulator transcription factor [Dyadobacter]TLU89363.1 response regulator transcription factor [Dyadobacter sediminis]GGC06047.1 DNA-binding response regulator [Dyadobacter sediminis]SKC20511.1 two component transcriptional regulator, winged helix family [Dyadobacter psychrophilus]